MKVRLEKTFALAASADTAWTLLQNIEAVAGCMPGASITERVDARHYKGTVAVKFGPASMSFRGELEVMELEPVSRTLHLVGKGTDSTGSSGVSMDLTARVEAVPPDALDHRDTGPRRVRDPRGEAGGRARSPPAPGRRPRCRGRPRRPAPASPSASPDGGAAARTD